MKKTYLMTPGPCPMPPEVGLAVARPIIHHRTDEYHVIQEAVTKGLKQVFKTKGDIFILSSSGSGALESAVVNTLSPGDTAIAIRGGKFGERWGEICEAYGVKMIPIDVEWGTAVKPQTVEETLKKNPEAKAVFATLCETSTSAKTDIEALAKITRNTPTILVVDAVSGLGCSDLQMDNWGVDVAVAGGQKGFMIPTGLAFVAISSKKTWDLVEKSTIPKYYFDWKPARKSAAKNETAWSSPASLIVGLKESLDMILAEGVDNVLARHSRLAKACRAGATALGLKLLAPDAPADGLTGVCAPEGVSGADLKKTLYKKYGINVAGGQEQLKGKIIRIAHMGYTDTFDIITVIAALEMALKDLGYPVEIGKGVKAAADVILTG